MKTDVTPARDDAGRTLQGGAAAPEGKAAGRADHRGARQVESYGVQPRPDGASEARNGQVAGMGCGQNAGCPICAALDHLDVGGNPDFPGSAVRLCRSCGLMWSHPAPTGPHLGEVYATTYRALRHEEPSDEYLESSDGRARAQRAFIDAHAGLQLRDARVLDIGCSAGSLLKAFAGETRRLTGVDPDARMIDVARERLPQEADLRAEPFAPGLFEGGMFDLVTASHVLEHVARPVSFLSDVLRLLRPDGAAFLEVPHETPESVAECLRAGYKGLMHLLFFDPATTAAAIEKAGGRVVYLSTFGPSRNSFSLVRPRRDGWRARLVRCGARALRLVRRREDLLSRETPREGIWVRVVMRKAAQ